MAAVVGGVNDNGVVINTLVLERLNELAEIVVNPVAAGKIGGHLKPPVAESSFQITRNIIILEAVFQPLGGFKTQMIVLMMRLEVRHKHKERLVVRFFNIFYGVIVYSVCAVAFEIKLVAVFVKNIAVIAV